MSEKILELIDVALNFDGKYTDENRQEASNSIVWQFSALRAENERLRGALRKLYQPAKIASTQIICLGGDTACQPCENREALCEALKEVEAELKGGE
jgi:hypothetical protein